MKKFWLVTMVCATMLFTNACSGGGVNTSSQSESLKADYAFYEDSIGNIKNTMGLSQEEADSVFTTLVTDCGVDEKIQYVFKGNEDNTYNVWSGLLQLDVTLKDNKVETVSNGTEQIYPEVHKNVLTQEKVKTAEVMNGSGTEKIGDRAYIEIKKAELQKVTQEDFKEFADTVVNESGYNYFSVICEDGTGIFFPGSSIIVCQYGEIDENGLLKAAIGDIMFQEDNTYIYQERKNELLEAEIKTAEVMNGSGTEKIGDRAYLEITKADLEKVTEEEFSEFVNTKVAGTSYNWFTIVCEDGTGIVINGDSLEISEYGEINEEGMLDKTIGFISLKGGIFVYEKKD